MNALPSSASNDRVPEPSQRKVENTKVHVVLASDINYLPGLEVTRKTIEASCSDASRLEFHIFDEASLATCATDGMPLWNGSHMPYLRLWLPQLLPTVDRVIYSDVDTIWNRDICELWDITAPQSPDAPAISWVRDMSSMRQAAGAWIERVAAGEGLTFDWTRYACSGICVMNLSKMRTMDFTRRALELHAKYGAAAFADQDYLNILFNGDSKLLPSVWGTMGDPDQLPPADARCVYHLTGVGRHFHDAVPTVYPPQYQLWWNVYTGQRTIHPRSRFLARIWPLHPLTRLLPTAFRDRVIRQWFFARVLCAARVI